VFISPRLSSKRWQNDFLPINLLVSDVSVFKELGQLISVALSFVFDWETW
jgi:hypothetical protein